MRCKQTALNPSPIIGVQRARLGRIDAPDDRP